jgi:Rieske Fe-S protein
VRGAFWLSATPLLAAFASLVSRHRSTTSRPRRLELPATGDAVEIVDDVIVSRSPRETAVFSARCTHLGCRISRVSDGLLVCPCHGSKFHPDGTVAAGPASRPLDRLAAEVDAKSGSLVVHVV